MEIMLHFFHCDLLVMCLHSDEVLSSYGYPLFDGRLIQCWQEQLREVPPLCTETVWGSGHRPRNGQQTTSHQPEASTIGAGLKRCCILGPCAFCRCFLCVSQVRVGVIQFGSTPRMEISLDSYSSKEELSKHIKKIQYRYSVLHMCIP